MIRLRPLRPADAPDLYRLLTGAAYARHQPIVPLTGRAEADRLIEHYAKPAPESGATDRYYWAIADRITDRFVGRVGLEVRSWSQGIGMISYAVLPESWGRGVATGAVRLLVDLLFTTTPLRRIEAICSVDNAASMRVLERAGLLREGLLRGYFVIHGEPKDHPMFGLLRSDWLARRA